MYNNIRGKKTKLGITEKSRLLEFVEACLTHVKLFPATEGFRCVEGIDLDFQGSTVWCLQAPDFNKLCLAFSSQTNLKEVGLRYELRSEKVWKDLLRLLPRRVQVLRLKKAYIQVSFKVGSPFW